MPTGIRFGGYTYWQYKEICSEGYTRLFWKSVYADRDIYAVEDTRDYNIKAVRDWAMIEIYKIIDAREKLVEIMCVHDEKLCDICREECGKVGHFGANENITPEGFSFPLVGQQVPPFHHGCRCWLRETAYYGFILFENRWGVSEEELDALNEIRAEEARHIAAERLFATLEIARINKETQNFVDNYFANCRSYEIWYEVKCLWGTDPCEGEWGTMADLDARGCVWDFGNDTCYHEAIGYEVIEICTGE